MSAKRSLLAALFLSVMTALCSADPLVIKNVTIIDGSGSPAVPATNIVMLGGVIQQVGKAGEVTVPEGADVVDGTGKFLIPGLWDMHIHAALIGNDQWSRHITAPLLLANGVVGFRDMGGNLETVRSISHESGLGMVTPGPMLEGPGDPFDGIIRVSNMEEARAAVNSLAQQKVDFIKVLSSLPRPAYFAIAEESKKLNLSFAGHVSLDITPAEVSDAGQKSIEHLDGILLSCSSEEDALRKDMAAALEKRDFAAFSGLRIRMLDSYDRSKAAALFAKFKKNGTWQVPTFSFLRTQTTLDDAEKLATPYLKYVPKSILDPWTEAAEKRKPSAAADLSLAQRRYQKNLELVFEMKKAGVGILAGTDVDGETPFIVPGFSLHDELKTLVDAGFLPMEALQSATLRAAQFLGREATTGTLEKGKAADAVLLDADPLADINNTRRIHAVILKGRLISRPELDKLLASAVQE